MSENLKSIINELYSEIGSDSISICISKSDEKLRVLISTINEGKIEAISAKIDLEVEV